MQVCPVATVQGVAVPHWPVEPHVWIWVPLHCVWPGLHTPMQSPEEQVVPPQVCTGVVDTRSGPHRTTCDVSLHADAPGLKLVQMETMGAHVPWLLPGAVSQFCPDGHVVLAIHVPPLQMRVTFCALPAHASAAGDEHDAPRTATAPLPASAPPLDAEPPLLLDADDPLLVEEAPLDPDEPPEPPSLPEDEPLDPDPP